METSTSRSLWHIEQTRFDPQSQRHWETVFTIGNGVFCTRGVFEEGYHGEERATFMHGLFDDVPLHFTELVNLPDALELEIFLAGERFSLEQGTLLEFQRHLDLRAGLLERQVRWRSPQGRTTLLHFQRFISLADPHLLLIRFSIHPLDYQGPIEIRAGLNGETDNLQFKHWEWQDQATSPQEAWLTCTTRKTRLTVAMGARLYVESHAAIEREGWDVRNHPVLVARTQSSPEKPVRGEKIVYLYSSRETTDPTQAVQARLAQTPPPLWDQAWAAHAAAWQQEWEACDVIIEGDEEAQRAVRFSVFQLLIAAPRQDERVSIGAKTLSGYGYRGHVFWDTEIFMLPLFTYTRPEIARNLLSYRWHTLEGARRKARRNGYKGAQYPWESAATGDEVTPTWVPHFNDPTQLIRIWTGDIEIHISADVAYAIHQYWQVTGDDALMRERGAEIILDTARFWASRAEWNPSLERYEYTDVIGPDEYHDHVDNNAYTNYLARWHLQTALKILEWLKTHHPDVHGDLVRRLELTPEELSHWQKVIEHLYCPLDAQRGLIEQFEGYFQRKDVLMADLEPRNVSVQVLFGIEGVNQTQAIKQPDVLMLLYLLPDQFNDDVVKANYDYYTPRTDHTFGSSLGPSIQAIMACRVGRPLEAYEHFMRAARADLENVRGNAEDGIHGASAGGVWQAVVFGFAGLRVSEHGWTLKPALPPHWKRVAFKFMWRGQPITVEVHSETPQHIPHREAS